MTLPEAQTETPIDYIEISSALDQHPSIRDALKGFLEKWKDSDVFQKAASTASSDGSGLMVGNLRAAEGMAENEELMQDAMETMKVICKNVSRVRSRLEFLSGLLSEEKALMAVTREHLFWELAKGLGFAQRPEIQKFLKKEAEEVNPKNHGLVLERTPDGRAAVYYSRKASAGGKISPYKMWPPVVLLEDNEIGCVYYFLTSSWGIIKQKEVPLKTTF